jgi:hypothetical protein
VRREVQRADYSGDDLNVRRAVRAGDDAALREVEPSLSSTLRSGGIVAHPDGIREE